MKYYDNVDLFGIDGNLFIQRFITNKYDVVYSPHLKKIGIMKAHWLWSHSVLRYYKTRDYILKLDSKLFFDVIPDIEEIKDCGQWISDKIINQKIERFLRLKAFL